MLTCDFLINFFGDVCPQEKKRAKPTCCVCSKEIRKTADARIVTADLAIKLKQLHGRDFTADKDVLHDRKCRTRKRKRREPEQTADAGNSKHHKSAATIDKPETKLPLDAPVISFCLFRKTSHDTEYNWAFMTYVHALTDLVKHIKVSDLLKIFRVVVYVDSTVNKRTRQMLEQAGVDEIREPGSIPKHLDGFPGFAGTLMRYWAFADYANTASHVVTLDADLPFSAQLPSILVKWFCGKEDVLRLTLDSYKENFPIVGCLFGLANSALREVGSQFVSLLESNSEDFKDRSYGVDQRFLAKQIFPMLKHKYQFFTLVAVGDDSMPKPTMRKEWTVKCDRIYESRSIVFREVM